MNTPTTTTTPLTPAELERAEALTKELTAFRTFGDLLAGGDNGTVTSYRPSLYGSQARKKRELADLYDRAQAGRGDNRRAYRG